MTTLTLGLLAGIFFQACEKAEDEFVVNGLFLKLSDYDVYEGMPADLVPSDGYELYQLFVT